MRDHVAASLSQTAFRLRTSFLRSSKAVSQSNRRHQLIALAMSLCRECATIDLEFIHAGHWSLESLGTWVGQADHALKNSQEMALSAQAGCQGCQFFSEIIALEHSTDMRTFSEEARSISIRAGSEEYRLCYQMDVGRNALRSIGLDLCLAAGTN